MQHVEVSSEDLNAAQVYEISSKRQPDRTKKTFSIINPATGKETNSYPLMNGDDVDRAIRVARNKSEEWGKTTFAQRKKIILKASQHLAKNAGKYADEIAAENGKTKMDALFEVGAAIDSLRYTAKNLKKALKTKKHISFSIYSPLRMCSYMFQPKGVVGIISPWNYPFVLSASPVASALAAGNSVVLKPSSQTTRSGMILKEAFEAAGLPRGVLQILTGSGSVTGQAMIEHAGLDMLFFTGSTEVGKEVYARGAERLLPVFLELGGIDAAIVTNHADLDRAAHGVVWSAFTNTGQTCAATEMILVDRAIYEPFIEKLLPIVENLKLGKGTGQLGSMTMESQRKIVVDQLHDALNKGAKILYQGDDNNPNDTGLWCQPTILTDVTPDMDVFHKETFGPLKCIIPYDTIDEAISVANSVEYGLSGCVYTKDLKEGQQIAERLKVGSVNVNDALLTYMVPELPFGGVKNSGVGFYHGEMGIQAFSDVKSITKNMLPLKKEAYWYPMNKNLDEVTEDSMKILFSGSIISRIRGIIAIGFRTPKLLLSVISKK